MHRLSSNDRIAARIRTRLAPIFDAPVAPLPAPTTGPIPMDYQELLAEIAGATAWLEEHTTPSTDRVSVALRLTRLEDARTAWDRHVIATTLARVGA